MLLFRYLQIQEDETEKVEIKNTSNFDLVVKNSMSSECFILLKGRSKTFNQKQSEMKFMIHPAKSQIRFLDESNEEIYAKRFIKDSSDSDTSNSNNFKWIEQTLIDNKDNKAPDKKKQSINSVSNFAYNSNNFFSFDEQDCTED